MSLQTGGYLLWSEEAISPQRRLVLNPPGRCLDDALSWNSWVLLGVFSQNFNESFPSVTVAPSG